MFIQCRTKIYNNQNYNNQNQGYNSQSQGYNNQGYNNQSYNNQNQGYNNQNSGYVSANSYAGNQCTANTGRFVDVGNGDVRDNQTGLVWQRCALGQRWTGVSCSGRASVYMARSVTSLLSSQGYRVPTIQELQTLVEPNCTPSINQWAFPNTQQGEYWSETPDAKRSNVFLTIDFASGRQLSSWGDNGRMVRGVR